MSRMDRREETYEPGYDYLDKYAMWSDVAVKVDDLKVRLRSYENQVMISKNSKDRLKWMKRILELTRWGFKPNFFKYMG